MKYLLMYLLCVLVISSLPSQSLTSKQLLEKSIQYHDPGARWKKFKGLLYMDQLGTDKNIRGSRLVSIDIPREYFQLKQHRDEEVIVREVTGYECTNSYNGSVEFSEDVRSKHQLTCDRAKMYRNYYLYLYGLPMKLKDPGTIIHPGVNLDHFEDKECYSIKVTYEKEVGEDTWYFYFDTSTYALIGYRFYHNESKNDGEFITLEGEININGIIMPRDRYWYTNKEREFLGADLLLEK